MSIDGASGFRGDFSKKLNMFGNPFLIKTLSNPASMSNLTANFDQRIKFL